MLTEEEKGKIREEEIFRTEVQKSLNLPKPSGRLLSFLNTSLGIWLLSSVVLGLLAWSFAQWQASRVNEEQIRKLDAEIEARLEATHSRMYTDTPETSPKVLVGPPGTDRTLLPEFANRNLKSLIYELHDRVPFWERSSVSKALVTVQDFEYNYVDHKYPFNEEFYKQLEELKQTRWTIHDSFVRVLLYNLWSFSPLAVLLILLLAFLVYWCVHLKWRDRKNKRLQEM